MDQLWAAIPVVDPLWVAIPAFIAVAAFIVLAVVDARAAARRSPSIARHS